MCECYKVGGPFIAEDPDCPAHGNDGYEKKLEAAAARIEALEDALREIAELPGEINPSNYTHDDVVTLNDAFVKTWQISRAALGEPT